MLSFLIESDYFLLLIVRGLYTSIYISVHVETPIMAAMLPDGTWTGAQTKDTLMALSMCMTPCVESRGLYFEFPSTAAAAVAKDYQHDKQCTQHLPGDLCR